MRTTLRPAVMKPVSLNPSVCALFDYSSIPLRRALILSVELVLGPGEKEKSDVSDTVLTSILPHQIVKKKMPARTGLTNGANDGSTTEVLRRDHLSVELGVPLQLHPVAEMVEGAADGHFV